MPQYIIMVFPNFIPVHQDLISIVTTAVSLLLLCFSQISVQFEFAHSLKPRNVAGAYIQVHSKFAVVRVCDACFGGCIRLSFNYHGELSCCPTL